ncbi:hypothetical protein JKP88DRAFT_289774 [Tribonema minus]|uniref:Uncharacterized protein n=1 Tax=Tribonema minus TaxID=303371 RepID=A0A836CGJ0_9STRA|nr:hypothetical protein JKP88DRAFT_289774 [Tribonema minus]
MADEEDATEFMKEKVKKFAADGAMYSRDGDKPFPDALIADVELLNYSAPPRRALTPASLPQRTPQARLVDALATAPARGVPAAVAFLDFTMRYAEAEVRELLARHGSAAAPGAAIAVKDVPVTPGMKLPFAMLEDLVEGQTVAVCREVLGWAERAARRAAPLVLAHGKTVLLRVCNGVLKQLSKT